MSFLRRRLVPALVLSVSFCFQAFPAKKEADLWVLKPVVRPAVPAGAIPSKNPIDAFITAQYKAKGLLRYAAPAEKHALLRRVYIDLIGIPPTPAEQAAFLADTAPDAYEKVVDQLLASDQHGVRYARRWLDVLRYADQDERMLAAPGIHYWRDWVIYALNSNMPYDQFVRAMLTGYRTNDRTMMSATGVRQKLEPRPEDMYALGFLARGDVLRDGKEVQEMPITAVETVSTAFMGLTVGCAKCHDHMYDPIKNTDFYAMKAMFDPLEVKKVTMATPKQILDFARATDELAKKRAPIDAQISKLTDSYRTKLYAERVAMLPADVRAIIEKPENKRTPAEMKIADDYYPILRIDPGKISEVMPEAERAQYKNLQKQLQALGGGRGRNQGLPAFWTAEVNLKRAEEPSYILTSGDPDRPQKDKPIKPGWPFMPKDVDWSGGSINAFSKWLTAPENPMFARVAVNRLWQWHFGEGLQKLSSDFGTLGGNPSNQALLDWLSSEFVAKGYDMKAMERLMVTSDTYKMSSAEDPVLMKANNKIDPQNAYLWRFRLERLEAEPLWDSILSAAGTLDTTVGGDSFNIRNNAVQPKPVDGEAPPPPPPPTPNRRGIYIARGFSPSTEVTPIFLQAYDVDDGRTPCPMRTQTVTAPQALFMMNGEEVDKASAKLAERAMKASNGDVKSAVDYAYQITLNRPPTSSEQDIALSYVNGDPEKMKNVAWLLFNLDEFVFVR